MIYFFLPAMLLLSFSVRAQFPSAEAEAAFGAWYDQTIGTENLPLAEGKIYLFKPRASTTHPFFIGKQWATGSLRLDGRRYDQLSLLYDLENEVLVMRHPDPFSSDGIIPDHDRLESFELHGHRFGKVAVGTAKGFFDFLYVGDSVSLLAKRQKYLKSETGGSEFKATNTYYLLYGKELHPVKNMRSLRRLFPQKRALLKDIRSRQKVRFTAYKEAKMIAFIRSFDHALTP